MTIYFFNFVDNICVEFKLINSTHYGCGIQVTCLNGRAILFDLSAVRCITVGCDAVVLMPIVQCNNNGGVVTASRRIALHDRTSDRFRRNITSIKNGAIKIRNS